jgi:hypothetical protein
MEFDNEQLKNNIMRRIDRVYFVRSFVKPFVFECAALSALIGSTAFFVSLPNIISNAHGEGTVTGLIRFIFQAFKNTELSVQVISVATVVVVILVARDSVIGLGRAAVKVRSVFT